MSPRRAPRALLTLALALAASSCGGNAPDVVVVVRSNSPLRVDRVHLVASGAAMKEADSTGRATSLPLEIPLTLSAAKSGVLHLTAQASLSGTIVAHGAADYDVASRTHKLDLVLEPETTQPVPGTVVVTPADPHVTTARTLQLHADHDSVTWSIDNPDGGTIDANGLFVAGSSVGSYVVTATAANGDHGSVTVTVGGARLDLLAGALGGPGMANGPGPLARFFNPISVAVDNNNVYVADINNGLVRVVQRSGDNVTGVLVDANKMLVRPVAPPRAVAVDGTTLYVLETNALSSYTIAADGSVTPLMPRFGLSIGTALSLAVSADHTAVYIGDTTTHAVYRFVLATKTVTTLIGTGTTAGTIVNPAALAVAPAAGTTTFETVFIADSSANSVLRCNASTGALVPWTVTPALKTPMGLAWRANILYIADSANNIIRAVNTLNVASGASVTTTFVAGAGGGGDLVDDLPAMAKFNSPRGMAVGTDGALFIADTVNQAIRRVPTVNQKTSTLAGGGPARSGTADGDATTARFNVINGVWADPAGIVYVADGTAVRKVEIGAASVTVSTLAPHLTTNIVDIVGDNDHLLFLLTNNNLFTIDLATGMFVGGAPVMDMSSRFVTAQGMGYDPVAKRLYVADQAGKKIYAYDPTDGSFDEVKTSATLVQPTEIEASPDGQALYVLDQCVLKRIDFDAAGTVTPLLGAATCGAVNGADPAARLGSALGTHLARDPANGLFLAEPANHLVRRIDLAGRSVGSLLGADLDPIFGRVPNAVLPGALPAALNMPVGVAVLPNRDLVVVDQTEHALLIAH